jgi:hypothetical protein
MLPHVTQLTRAAILALLGIVASAAPSDQDIAQKIQPSQAALKMPDAARAIPALGAFGKGGAPPNSVYDDIVWNNARGETVMLSDLFNAPHCGAALLTIAETAKTGSHKKFPPSLSDDSDLTEGQVRAEPDGFGPYALTSASDEAKANGVVPLWGAVEAWPQLIGEVRLAIPIAVFRSYLTLSGAREIT